MNDNTTRNENTPSELSDKKIGSSNTDSESNNETKSSPGIFSMLQSVLAAMIGIQSEEKRKEDFENGHAGNYIFIGIVMVLIFIFSLIKIVDLIIANSK